MNKPSTYGFIFKMALISFLLIGSLTSIFAQWEAVIFDSDLTPANFPNVQTTVFSTPQIGLSAGNNGLVLRTNDSGLNWETVLTESNALNFVDGQFTNPTTAFFIGQEDNFGVCASQNGVIARTKNYGATWEFTYLSTNLFACHFPTENTGYSVGGCGAVYRTTNAGDSWQLLNTGILEDVISSVFFTDEQNGFVAGLNDVFLSTADGGDSWTNIDLPNTQDYKDITFIDASLGFVLTDDKVLKTLDGGNNWSIEIDLPISGGAYTSMIWIDENIGWVGKTSSIFKTTDGGNSWTLQFANTPNTSFTPGIQDLFFLNENTGFLVGEQGYFKTTTGGESLPNFQYLAGNVFNDLNQNCNLDVGDYGLENWIIEIKNDTETFYATTDFNGNYFTGLPTGDYDVSLSFPNKNWTNSCQLIYPIILSAPFDTLNLDLPAKKAVDCPVLEVDVSTEKLTQCADNIYTVRYANTGTGPALSPYVDILLDDDLTMVSSNWSSMSGNTYNFDLSDLEEGEVGTFSFVAFLSCDTEIGQTHSVKANIYPNTFCLPEPPTWSGASLAIESVCEGDSVNFTITNVGVSAMQSAQDFVITEDHILFMNGPVILDENQDTTFTVYPKGTTLRLEIDQVPNHPGRSNPSATHEACTTDADGNISTGYVNQLPEDDANVFVSIDAQESVDATTASTNNLKRAYPKGYGDEHYIEANVDLDYHILFENNTTETVYTVIVQDTLSQWFNASSIRQGSASHEYDFSLSGNGMAKFVFTDVQLAPGEKGFIKFRVQQKEDNPDSTFIENSACISFDYGLNNKTNTTFHQVSSGFLEVVDDIEITGTITNENGNAIAQVEIQNNWETGLYTDDNGCFSIDSATAMTAYTLTPYKNQNLLNGVDAADLYLIQQHILENEFFETSYKLLAADVNNSGSISTKDVLDAQKTILLLEDNFPDNTSWRFVKESYEFEDAADPFSAIFPEAFFLNIPLSENEINFTGIKIGDVNGSQNPLEIINEDAESRAEKVLFLEDLNLEKGQPYEVPVYIEDGEELAALQFALQLDMEAINFEGVDTDATTICRSDNFGYRFLGAGVITACWFDQNATESNHPNQSSTKKLFHLRFTAKKNGPLSSFITLSPEHVDGLAYERKDDLLTKELKRKLTYLRFKALERPTFTSPLALEIFPNPISNNDLFIKYNLAKDSNVKITVHNTLGQLVETILFKEKRSEGTYTYKWDASNLPRGSYFIQLHTNAVAPLVKKVIKS